MAAGFIGQLFGSAISFLRFVAQSWSKTFEDEFKDPDTLTILGDEILARIQGRTPVLTGALRSSEKYDVLGSDEYLLYFYADEGPQMDEWGRVYAGYVEGLPLGEVSWTIEHPAQMFFLATTNDIDTIANWMQIPVNKALDRLSVGIGVPMQ